MNEEQNLGKVKVVSQGDKYQLEISTVTANFSVLTNLQPSHKNSEKTGQQDTSENLTPQKLISEFLVKQVSVLTEHRKCLNKQIKKFISKIFSKLKNTQNAELKKKMKNMNNKFSKALEIMKRE